MVHLTSKELLPPAGGEVLRVNCRDPHAVDIITNALFSLMFEFEQMQKSALRLILCIGSDRSTGDSLGPLVGAHLAKLNLPRTMIWGTLADPVHALNLESHMRKLPRTGGKPLVIAVDASLGKPGSIGVIEVGKGPLYPGAGVNKKLPPVGNIYLSGIVNLGGFMEQMVLQSTRLFHVMEIAMVIARGLQQVLAGERHQAEACRLAEHNGPASSPRLPGAGGGML
jgi:putative sporulation protein YyaC